MINTSTHFKLRLVGAWSAIAYIVLLSIGFWLLADFIPAHSPTATAEEIAQLYAENRTGIRIGMILEMFAAMAYIPLTACIAYYISRVEGHVGMLTITQALSGMGNVCLTFYPAMWWLIAAFRPDQSPEIIRLLNDAAWLQFVGGITIFYPILWTIAIASFLDKSATPFFPRWVGYLNLWYTFVFVPGLFIFFVKTGPFAWDGLLAFWLPLFIFGSWFVVMYYCLRRAVAIERAEAAGGAP
jgi:hypothetical protein